MVTWIDNPVAASADMEVVDLDGVAGPDSNCADVTNNDDRAVERAAVGSCHAAGTGVVDAQAGQLSTTQPLPVPVRLHPPPAGPAWCLQAQQQNQSLQQGQQQWQPYNPNRWPPLYAPPVAVAWGGAHSTATTAVAGYSTAVQLIADSHASAAAASMHQLQAVPGTYHPFGTDAGEQGRSASFLAHKHALEGVLEAGNAEGGRHCDGPAPEPPVPRPTFVRGKLLGPDGRPKVGAKLMM
jgi:hypothetical protein